jgi:hypothetical protein
MSTFTNDQYIGLHKLINWYKKYKNQFIEISGVVGTGVWDLIEEFIKQIGFDDREIIYLSQNQKQVLDMAYKKYHIYYTNGWLYKYIKFVDFNTLPVIDYKSKEIKYQWKKEVRDKIDPKYKLMIVFDSSLLNHKTIQDLSSFGLPVILIRDEMLLPSPDSYTFLRESNIILREINSEYIKFPITYFAHKILNNDKLIIGNYDNVSIVTKNHMNLYNINSSDMNIVMNNTIRNEINNIYREKILKRKNITNIIGERLIVMENMYKHKLVNPDEKKIKIYLTKGVVGVISKINKHAINTKYVPMEFTPEFYHLPFKELMVDRHYLNNVNINTPQSVPDEIFKVEYAYALTPILARYNNWDKVTLIIDNNEELDNEIFKRFIYTAITRAKKSLTIVI